MCTKPPTFRCLYAATIFSPFIHSRSYCSFFNQTSARTSENPQKSSKKSANFSMSTAFQSSSFNLWGILSESKRIINAHSRHFLALSVFFLLPLSFSLIIYPTLESQSNSILNRYNSQKSLFFFSVSDDFPHPTKSELFLPLGYSLFVLFIALIAVSTITYSTFHGFYGRPVKLVSSIKSVLYSFFPLLFTFIFSQLVMCSILFFAALLAAIVYKGSGTDFHSIYFMGFVLILGIVVLFSLIWLQVNWSLGTVIVVVESKWGYEPLRRSSYLVKGMRGVVLSMLTLYGLSIGFLVWGCSSSVADASQDSSGWSSWVSVLQTVLSSALMTSFMLHNVAANVVLYMYCKALHGELALEIVDEFGSEYVSLPFDSDKVPHLVSVV